MSSWKIPFHPFYILFRNDAQARTLDTTATGHLKTPRRESVLLYLLSLAVAAVGPHEASRWIPYRKSRAWKRLDPEKGVILASSLEDNETRPP
jgi:hypothetical protein